MLTLLNHNKYNETTVSDIKTLTFSGVESTFYPDENDFSPVDSSYRTYVMKAKDNYGNEYTAHLTDYGNSYTEIEFANKTFKYENDFLQVKISDYRETIFSLEIIQC